jgi:DNA polymerase-3 subunit chi
VTEIAFHFNAPDRLAYTCRLLRKAVASGARLVVTGPAEALDRLDTELWTFSATDFVPHCRVQAEPALLAASPVVLAGDPAAAPHQQVLLNLGAEVPAGFERFERVIEVVGLDDADRLQARTRWRHYADRGYAMTRHDLASKAGS